MYAAHQETISELKFNRHLLETTLAEVIPKDKFRVVTYNVLYGFSDVKATYENIELLRGESRKKAVSYWLQLQAPSIVAMQELKGFDSNSFLRFSHNWGHTNAVMSKSSSGKSVGISARCKVKLISDQLPGLDAGFIHGFSEGMHIINVHLSSRSYRERLSELSIVLSYIDQTIDSGQPVLLLGDFNAFSRYDVQEMGGRSYETILERYIKRDLKGQANLANDDFDYSVIESVLGANFINTYKQSSLQPTRRIDYIFHKNIKKSSKISSHWFVNQPMSKLSDHYPLVADFDITSASQLDTGCST